MKIYSETSLEDFEAWSGAIDTLERVKKEGLCDQLEAILEEIAPEEGYSDVALNDILWFESEWIFDTLGISDDDEDEDEDEEN